MSANVHSWGLIVLLGLIGPIKAEPASLVESVRVKPVGITEIGVPAWEQVATTPKGASRYGGADTRPFAFSPDGNRLLTLNGGGWQFEYWDVSTGKTLLKFGDLGDHLSVAFFPDGKTFAAAAHDESASVAVWDVEKGRRLRDLDEGVNVIPFHSVAISPDGRMLALAGVWGVGSKAPVPVTHFWDVARGEELRVGEASPLPAESAYAYSDNRFESVCFAPDGTSLAAVLDHRIVLLDATTGKERRNLGRHFRTYARSLDYFARFTRPVAFSPNGRILAAGCDDGAVRMWDVKSGREYPPFVGHVGHVRCLAFGHDGKTLRSFGGDNKVLTWPLDKLKVDWLPRRDKLDAQELAACWQALGGDDVLARHVAVYALAAAPESALSFLREHIKKPDAAEMETVKRLLADLKKDDFNGRKHAADDLVKYSDLAVPAITQMKRDQRDDLPGWVEFRLRGNYPTKVHARALNALDVLWLMDTDGARLLLKELSEGVDESLLTGHARVLLRSR
jgi:WD40 repeat protein